MPSGTQMIEEDLERVDSIVLFNPDSRGWLNFSAKIEVRRIDCFYIRLRGIMDKVRNFI